MDVIYIIIIITAILSEGFFAGSEIAIISLNRIRLRILAEAKEKKAVIVQAMLQNPGRLLATTLVGTNIAVVVSSSFCTRFLYNRYGASAELMTTIILSPVILIFAELIPKAIFSQSANSIALYLGSVLRFFWKAFYPIVWFVNIFTGSILKLVPGGIIEKKRNPFVTREEIRYLIKESESNGHIDTYERSIIYKIFDIGKKKIGSVMRKLDELIFISDTDTMDEVLLKAKKSGYTRFPVRTAAGKFIGIVNILDIVYEKDKTIPIARFLRPLEFIDDNIYVDNALFRIKAKKQTMAIAIDSDEKPTGFFTMEDLLEELIGEID
jgi:putative hemolysin